MMEVKTQSPTAAATLTDWVKQAQKGERQAFEQVVRLTEGLARKTAYPLLRSQQVDDALQEAYLVVFQKIHHLRKPEAFQAWLVRIVLHVCYALKKKTPLLADADERVSSPDSTGLVDQQMALREALEQISEDARNILIMREFLQLDYEEISFALKLPLGTVRSRLHYGRKKLAKLLGED